ncbi:MAG: hypothetical protein ACREUC_12470 [Steroidobacteraceae bacterium]
MVVPVLSVLTLSPGLSAEPTRESPFVCDRLAMTPEQRARQSKELGPALRSAMKGVNELPDGYEFQLPPDLKTLQMAAEWAMNERLCCPFLDIELQLQREGGPLLMRLSGRKGTKEFIEADLQAWLD